jgi:hypothetical protein
MKDNIYSMAFGGKRYRYSPKETLNREICNVGLYEYNTVRQCGEREPSPPHTFLRKGSKAMIRLLLPFFYSPQGGQMARPMTFNDRISIRLTKRQRRELERLAGGRDKIAPFLRGLISTLATQHEKPDREPMASRQGA